MAHSEIIRDLRASATLVISSHDLAEIQRMCDSVAIINHGVLLEHDTVAEITRANEILRLTFARALDEAEQAAVTEVAGVTGIRPIAENVYAVSLDTRSAAKSQDQLIAAVVARLIPTCAVPRKIEEGVALEDAFLEMTKGSEPRQPA